jgi:hypothetical protein
MGAPRYRTSRIETVALGTLLGVLGGALTFVWVQDGVYAAALSTPGWAPAGAALAAGVSLSLLRLELRSAAGVLVVLLPLSYGCYMLFVLSPQLLAGWSLNTLLLVFTYGAGGQGFIAWLVTFPMVFVAGYGTHLVVDELYVG